MEKNLVTSVESEDFARRLESGTNYAYNPNKETRPYSGNNELTREEIVDKLPHTD